MMRWLRRVLWLGVLVGGGVAGYRAWARKQSLPSAASSQWPPLPPSAGAREASSRVPSTREPASTPPPAAADKPVEAPRWLPPVDGSCPAGYPLKANNNSGIFHVPGGRFYDRTVAERCYANAEDAIADGYRQAKA